MRKTAFIFMASGFGSRFGSNKLLASFQGKPLYCYGLESILEAARTLCREDGFEAHVIAVSQYGEILEDAQRRGAEAVFNEISGEGIAASLRLGILAAPEDTDLYLFSVADQPYMKADTAVRLVRECLNRHKGMGCVCCQGKRGNPAVFASEYRQELLELKGNRGGSVIMKRHPQDLMLLEASGDELRDIDTPEDLCQGPFAAVTEHTPKPVHMPGEERISEERG